MRASRALSNLTSKQGPPPPEGLLWGDGELGSKRREGQSSPDIKGVFGEGTSVVAVPPKAPAPVGGDAIANLFAGDQRVAAPLLAAEIENDNEAELMRRNNRGLWSAADPSPTPTGVRVRAPGLPRAVTGAIIAAPPPPEPRVSQPRVPIEPVATGGMRSLELEGEPSAPSIELVTPRKSLDVARPSAPQPHPAQRGAEAQQPHPAQRGAEAMPSVGVTRRSGDQLPAVEPKASPKKRRKTTKNAAATPGTSAQGRRPSAAQLMFGLCGVLIIAAISFVAGGYAGAWPLPRSTAAMLGLGDDTTRLARGGVQQPAPAQAAKPALPSPEAKQAPQPSAASAPPEVQAAAAEPPPSAATPTSAAAEVAPEPEAEPVKQAPLPTTPKAAPADHDEELKAASNERLLSLARAKQRAHDGEGAEALLRRAISVDPEDHHAMEALVEVLLDLQRGAEAAKYAEQIVRKRPKRASYRLLEGDALLLQGDKVGAARAFRAALALEPDNREAKRRLSGL